MPIPKDNPAELEARLLRLVDAASMALDTAELLQTRLVAAQRDLTLLHQTCTAAIVEVVS